MQILCVHVIVCFNSWHDFQILNIILQTIIDHPSELKYKRINVAKVSDIFHDVSLSLHILENVGFVASKNNMNCFIFEEMPQTLLYTNENHFLRHLYYRARDAYKAQSLAFSHVS